MGKGEGGCGGRPAMTLDAPVSDDRAAPGLRGDAGPTDEAISAMRSVRAALPGRWDTHEASDGGLILERTDTGAGNPHGFLRVAPDGEVHTDSVYRMDLGKFKQHALPRLR